MKLKALFKPANLACLAMLVALQVVLSRFLSINTPVVKIGFSFIPVMFAGALFGPAGGALVGAVSDFLGAMLFPFGAYFPGYTITAALSGAVYGFLLADAQKARLIRIALAYLITTLVVTLGFNTLFIALNNEMYVSGEGASLSRLLTVYFAMVPTRLAQAGGMYVVQVALTFLMLEGFWLDTRVKWALRGFRS